MREIKFRAWDDTNKRFPLVGFGILGETTVFDLCAQYQLEHGLTLHIDQATGLKDKNGVEIYEGDFVKKPGESGAPYQVIWQNGGFRGVSSDGDQYGPYTLKLYVNDSNPELVVIGNIHQHPELLKTNK